MKNIFTICLVTYRDKEFKDALSSIKKLNFQNFDLIVSDDGKDSKNKIFLKKHYPQAKYFHNYPSLGEVDNSNQAIFASKTEFVCLFHDDDLFNKNFFDEIIFHINKDADIDIIYTGRQMVNEKGKIIGKQTIQGSKIIYKYDSNKILDKLVLNKKLTTYVVPLMTPGLIFRKNLFKKIGGFDQNIDTHCDGDLLYKLLAVSKKTLFINKELYVSCVRLGSSGRTKSSEKGTVYWAQKGIIDNFLLFCKKNRIMKYIKLKKNLYSFFAKKSIEINGPIIWTKLRFRGRKSEEIKIILLMLIDIIKLNKILLLNVKFYLASSIALLVPKSLIKTAHKLYLSRYLSTK